MSDFQVKWLQFLMQEMKKKLHQDEKVLCEKLIQI